MEKELKKKKTIQLAGYIRDYYDIEEKDIKTYSPLALAYIGDGIYDLVIRTFVIEKGNAQLINSIEKLLRWLRQRHKQNYFIR